MRGPISSVVEALPRNETLKRGVRSLDTRDRLRRYQRVLSLLPGDQIDGLFKSDVLPLAAGDEILRSWEEFSDLMVHTDELGGLQFIELRSTLPDELLMYADKLSMAHGLEARVPYLDREVVEYGERLPASFKVRNGGGNGCTAKSAKPSCRLRFSDARNEASPRMSWMNGSAPRNRGKWKRCCLIRSRGYSIICGQLLFAGFLNSTAPAPATTTRFSSAW